MLFWLIVGNGVTTGGAYFFVGNKLPIDNNGTEVAYPKDSNDPLEMHTGNKHVKITLPNDMKTSDTKWLSVFSPDIDLDLGSVIFPKIVDINGKIRLFQYNYILELFYIKLSMVIFFTVITFF